MTLLNYTTKISPDKTIGEIQKTLVAHGAVGVLAETDGQGMITSLSFKISLEGKSINFRLPNDRRAVLHILNQDKKVPRSYKNNEQAIRVSWRILKVWVDAQMALIETRMVKMEEVFLPYAIQQNGRTVSETMFAQENRHLIFR